MSKIIIGIAILVVAIILIVLVVSVFIRALSSLENKDHRCEDCVYYEKHFCKHWEESRKESMLVCECFKAKKQL